MNIEEERKAFERFYSRQYGTPLDVLHILRLGETYSIKANDNIRRAWETWLYSKEHASEMAKPVATWYAVGGLFRLHTGVKYAEAGLFTSVEEAKVWAQANGYRVVDE